MIYVIATSQVKPESRDAFIKGAKECIAATRQEKGCISYESHAGINDPNLFVVVERWETREDLNAHAPRVMGVLDPLRVVIENYEQGKSETFETANNPENPAAGTRSVPFSRVI